MVQKPKRRKILIIWLIPKGGKVKGKIWHLEIRFETRFWTSDQTPDKR